MTIYLALIFIQLVSLYFLTKGIAKRLYIIFKKFLKSERFTIYIISLLYFPGTLTHELSHAAAASLLLLKVKEINLIPRIEESRPILGYVKFEKKDFLRGSLVGISPIIFGLGLLYLIFAQRFIFSESAFQNVFYGYLVFSISSTMFSSRQDLADFVYMLPIALIVVAIIYFFQIDIQIMIKNEKFLKSLLQFLKEVNLFIFASFLINMLIFVALELLGKYLYKK